MKKYKLETIAHLSCINNTKDEIDKILEELKIFGQTFMEIKERKEKKEA